MSEQSSDPKHAGVLSNPQILGAIITGIVSVLVAVVGIIPQLAKNNDPTHTPTPLAGVVVTFTYTPIPITQTATSIMGATDTPSLDVFTPTTTPLPSASETPLSIPTLTPEPPTPEPPTSAPVQSPNVRLYHNNRSFTVLNIHTRKVSLSGVVFEGGGGRWESSQWGPIANDVTQGDCLRMRDQNSGQQNPPAACGDLLALVLVGDSAIFWRDDDGFTVSQNGAILATCSQESETCDVFVPQP